MSIKDVGNWPVFLFQWLLHSPQALEPAAPQQKELRIKPFDLSEAKKHIPLLSDRGWVFQLDKAEKALDTDKLKEHFISHRPESKR